jgi:predicted GNAT superfamily acetyltransferase
MSDPIRLSIPDGYYAPADVRQIIADLREQVGEPLTEERAAWEALLVEARAEIAKLRALVPGVEAEWREEYSHAVRWWDGMVDGDEDPIPALTAFSDGYWRVRNLHGVEIASGVAPSLDEAIRDCEATARALGVLS